ncbi:MAG TPA: flagellar hook-length control protein FliK [Rhodanobacter sp.]|nr:flagellar hook-length control protein FliK [Rhodanobacter sp.]
MSAHAVGSPPAIPASTKAAPNAPAHGSTAAFEQQLHAARQRGAEPAPERAPAPSARPQRSPDPDPGRARARPNDPAAPGTHARQPAAGTGRPEQDPHHAPDNHAVAPTPAGTAQVAATVPVPATAGAATPVAEALAGAASMEATSVEQDADGGEQGAAALVGAMLALIGPAVNKVLTSAAALSASSGDAVATAAVAADAGNDVPKQVGDAAAMAVTTSIASTALPAQLLAANGMALDPKSMRDSAKSDAAPALVFPAPTLAALATPLSVPQAAPAGSHAFAQELGQQVSWFVGQGVTQARIRLHPEELGSLDLKISVSHDRVDVVFQAQHPGAVTAVQQSLPQLGQMLAQHGLSLGHTEVGQHDRGNQPGPGDHGDSTSEVDEVHGAGLVTPVSQLGLLDAFA